MGVRERESHWLAAREPRESKTSQFTVLGTSEREESPSRFSHSPEMHFSYKWLNSGNAFSTAFLYFQSTTYFHENGRKNLFVAQPGRMKSYFFVMSYFARAIIFKQTYWQLKFHLVMTLLATSLRSYRIIFLTDLYIFSSKWLRYIFVSRWNVEAASVFTMKYGISDSS